MDPCIYASQHKIWLEAASGCPPTQLVCFRSNRKWAKAATLLDRRTMLPILFRQHDDDGQHFTCRFAARLVEVRFRDQFGNDSERLAWLDQKLWLQRESWRQREGVERGKSQYKKLEVDKFMAAQTWYVVQSTRKIPPLPLVRLRKLANNQPLAPEYKWGYAVCQLSTQEIDKFGVGAAAV